MDPTPQREPEVPPLEGMDAPELGAPDHLEASIAPSSTTAEEQEANEEAARSIPITGDFEKIDDATPLPELPIPDPPTGRSPFVAPQPEEAARWQASIEAYQREADAMSEQSQAARLYLEVGRIYEEQLALPREAATAYQRAFNLNPTDPSILSASRSLFAKVANWAMVLQILDHEIRRAEVPEYKAALLAERGMIHEDKLSAPDQALRAYSAALDVWPEEPTAINGLERLHLIRREYAALYEVYRRALNHAEKRYRRLPLLLSSAQLAEDRLERPKQAIEHYQEILTLDPNNPVAISALRRLSLAVEDWSLLAEALKLWGEEATDPEEAGRRYWTAGRVERDRLGDVEGALKTQLLAMEKAPANLQVLRDIEQIYSSNDHPEEVVKVLRREAEVSDDPRDRVPVLARLGEVLEQLSRPEEAIEALEAAVEAMPRYVPARQALGRMYAKHGRDEQLAALFQREVELDEDQAGKALSLMKLAEVRADRLDDADGAIEALERALELNSSYEPAVDLMERLLLGQERWDALYELMLTQAEQVSDEELTVFRLDYAGRIAQDKLSDPERAKRAFERVLELRPRHRAALRALGRLASAEGRWADRLELYDREIEASEDPVGRLDLMFRAASLLSNRMDDSEGAIERLELILTREPGYQPALRSVSRLYQAAGRHEDLLRAFRREVTAAGSREHKVSLLFSMAGLQVEQLGDSDAAVATLEEILELDPLNLPALRALAAAHRKAGAYERLIEVLRREAETQHEPSERTEILLEIAELCEERLDRSDQAAEIYQEVLSSGQRPEAAVEGLVRVYSSAGLWNALTRALRRAVQHTEAPQAKVALLVRVAEVSGDRLGNLDAAASALEEAQELASDNLSVLTQLERVSVARRDWARALSVSALLSHHETDPRLFAARQIRMAVIKETLLDPPESGAEHYRLALETVPDHPVALRELELAYLRAGQWEGLSQLYHREARVSGDPGRKVVLLTRAADVAEHRIGDDSRAGALYEEALTVDPTHLPAVRGRRRTAERTGDAEAIRLSIQREGAATADPARAEELLFKLGEEQQAAGADPAVVMGAYERLLDRAPAHTDGFYRLEALYLEHGREASLLEVTKRRAEAVDDAEERRRLLFSAGQLAEDKLGDQGEAMGLYERVLAEDPEHAGALIRLGPLLVEARRWDDALTVLHRTLAATKDPEILHRSLRALAVIYHNHRRDLVKCVQSLQAALQIQTEDVEGLEHLAQVYEEGQDWRSAVNVRLRQVEVETEPEAQVQTLMRLGRLYEAKLGDREHAVLAYDNALELAPGRKEAIGALMNLYERAGELEAMQALITRYRGLLPEAERARVNPYLMRLSAAYETREGDDDRAAGVLSSALDIDAGYEPALERLAQLYAKQDARCGEAIDIHKQLLRRDPFRVESYLPLFELFQRVGRPDPAFVVAELLVALRAASPEAELFYAERKAQVPPRAARGLSEQEHLDWIVHPKERVAEGSLRAVFSVLGRELSKLYPGDLGLYQLNPKQDRVGPRSRDPIRLKVDQLSEVLSPPSFDLWVTGAFQLELFIENTRPLALIVGGRLAQRLQEKDQRFRLARELERMCGGHHLLTRVPADELPLIVDAVARMGDPAAPITEDGQRVAAMVKTLSRALPSKARRQLEAAGVAISGHRFELPAYKQACAFTRDRAGLTLTNDIEVALRNIVERRGSRMSFRDAAGARSSLGEISEVRALLEFAMSEAYFKARAKLGFSVER